MPVENVKKAIHQHMEDIILVYNSAKQSYVNMRNISAHRFLMLQASESLGIILLLNQMIEDGGIF